MRTSENATESGEVAAHKDRTTVADPRRQTSFGMAHAMELGLAGVRVLGAFMLLGRPVRCPSLALSVRPTGKIATRTSGTAAATVAGAM
jgi:hypothetical protein